MALSVGGWGWLYRATSVPSHLCADGLRLSASRYSAALPPKRCLVQVHGGPECVAMTAGYCSEVNKSYKEVDRRCVGNAGYDK